MHLGSSSWTFPGWSGIVYPPRTSERALADHGLRLYARYPLFRAVGVDRTYYAPLPERDAARYAAELPAGFPCVFKAWSGVTTARDARTGERISTFLDPVAFEATVLRPLRGPMRGHVGAVVLEFPPMRGAGLMAPAEFAARLDAFLGAVGGELPLSVELRNRELLTPAYLEVLARRGVAHTLNLWEQMPDIGQQLALPGVLAAPFVVCRLLLRPGTRHGDRKQAMAPFDRNVDPNPEMREDVATLAALCEKLGKVLFVLVNNKAEGSSPLTVLALAERIALGRG